MIDGVLKSARGSLVALDGEWEIRADEDAPTSREGTSARSQKWRSIDLPAPWQRVFPDEGPIARPNAAPSAVTGVDRCWFRRRIELAESPAPDERLWLRLDAVATRASVFLDDDAVGEWTGDWVPVQFDIAKALRQRAPARDAALSILVDRLRPGPPREVDGAPVQSGHITKGFHDVLSIQHAGLWQSVSLRLTGPIALVPDGFAVHGDPRSGMTTIVVELEPHDGRGSAAVSIHAPDGTCVGTNRIPILRGQTRIVRTGRIADPLPWSPESPALYRATLELFAEDISAIGENTADETESLSDREDVRFGFRRVEASESDRRRILLNGRPLFLSGVLDWGHEPRLISPAPSPETVRERFAALRARGFNLVCLCMWYAPPWLYDIADEMGMLIWQEHPVWKPPMEDALLPEYRAQYERMFRRDRRHASVIIVSGACEHERFAPALAEWWWRRAREELPLVLRQVQTAFLHWSSGQGSDLDDEHTYESAGRWLSYLDDLEAARRHLAPRPFVMGESVLYVAWPETPELVAALGGERPWWAPACLDAAIRTRRALAARFGVEEAERFLRRSERWHLRGRKRQVEAFRADPSRAGLVMNHLRDVPVCPCGFMDDLDRWRFAPDALRAFLDPVVLLARSTGAGADTSEALLAGPTPRRTTLAIGLANFGASHLAGTVEVTLRRVENGEVVARGEVSARCARGDVRWGSWEFDLSPVAIPTAFELRARMGSVPSNAWTLWALPELSPFSGDRDGAGTMFLLDDVAPQPAHPIFEERRYSSGWGLPMRSWHPRPPDPRTLLLGAPLAPSDRIPSSARVVVATRWSTELATWIERGGRALLLPRETTGPFELRFVQLWAHVPFTRAAGPLSRFGDDWVFDLLDLDLTRRWTRAMECTDAALAERIEPFVRLFRVHDAEEHIAALDALCSVRIGAGVLCVSTLDHAEPAGGLLLSEILRWLQV